MEFGSLSENLPNGLQWGNKILDYQDIIATELESHTKLLEISLIDALLCLEGVSQCLVILQQWELCLYSCLVGQPHQLWQEDMVCLWLQKKSMCLIFILQTRHKEGRTGLYMLRNFGKVYNAVSNTNSTAKFQVTFIAERVRRSLITIRMEADSLRAVINKYVIATSID